MSNFFEKLPDVAFRRLYHLCDADTKVDLSTYLKNDGLKSVLDRSGVLNFKERIFCPACQLTLAYDEFGNDHDRSGLGFHMLYREEAREMVGDDEVVHYKERKNVKEEHVVTDHMLSYFIGKLAMCYNTTDVNAMRLHLETEHKNIFPAKFFKGYYAERAEAVDTAVQIGTPLAAAFYFNRYAEISMLLHRKKEQINQVTEEFCDVFEKYQSAGARYTPIQLIYDEKYEVLQHFQALKNFHLFTHLMETTLKNEWHNRSYGKH